MDKLTYCLLLTLLVITTGCNSVKPLSLSPYRRNIIIRPDNSIMVENDVVDFRKFREELSKRMITDKDRIVLHVHKDVQANVFDAVFGKLKESGYTEIKPVLYKD